MGLFDRNPEGGGLISPISTVAEVIAGGGGGITWATPIDSNVSVSSNNAWDLGSFSLRLKRTFSVSVFTGSNSDVELTNNLNVSSSSDFTLLHTTAAKGFILQTGAGGKISLKDGSQGTVGHVWTSTGILGEGNWAAAGGAGATTALDNLAAVAINTHLLPGLTNDVDLGSNAKAYRFSFINRMDFIDAGQPSGRIRATGSTLPSGQTPACGVEGILGPGIALYTINKTDANAVSTAPVFIETGNKSNVGSTGATGHIAIKSGDSFGGNSGDITLTIGTAGVTPGEFKFLKSGIASVIGQVWTATGVLGEGYWAAAGGGGASLALDNLAATAVNISILPGVANSIDLGSGSFDWREIHSRTLYARDIFQATTGNTPLDIKTVANTITGNINIETGPASAGNSGILSLVVGTATTTQGTFRFTKAGDTVTVGHVWTANAADGTGYWAAAAGGGGDLWSDPVNAHILPTGNTNTYDIGGAGAFMKVIYANDFRGPKIRLTDAIDGQSNHLEITGTSAISPEGTSYGVSMKTIQVTGADSLGIWTVATGTSPTGSISIQTGSATGGTDGSGSIQLWIGPSTGGTQGSFKFLKSGVASVVGQVWTATGTAGEGYWSLANVWANGTTGLRPGSPVIGQTYFDTSLGKPIWFDSTNWVDATGATV